MLDVILWILIVVLFIVSFIGVIYPIIPSVLLIWIGFLLYQFGINSDELGWLFWIAVAILTVLLFVADIVANSYFVKKFGGSKWGERALCDSCNCRIIYYTSIWNYYHSIYRSSCD